MHEVTGDSIAPHYVRFIARDRPGIIASVGAAFARYGINIEAVLQLPRHPKDRLPFVATLEPCAASLVDRALADIAALEWVVEPPLSLPVLFAEARAAGRPRGAGADPEERRTVINLI